MVLGRLLHALGGREGAGFGCLGRRESVRRSQIQSRGRTSCLPPSLKTSKHTYPTLGIPCLPEVTAPFVSAQKRERASL